MNIRLMAAAMLASVAISAVSANATDLEVTHWWTSGGEAAAVKVLADQYNALGNNKWVDGAIAGAGSTATPLIVTRILGGNPMGATQLNTGRDAEELVKAGLMTDLTELAEKEHWKDIIRPAKLLDACTYQGHIYCIPVNIHSWQWMWVNRHVFEDNGMKVPANWDEFAAEAPKLKDKGIVPLATGAPWQVDGIRSVMQVGIGGKDLYLAINQKKSDEAVRSADNRKVWTAFGQAREMVDDSYSGRDWNMATNMVIEGKAAGQIMGDWAQGEFGVAKKVAGKDYDCLPGLGFHALLDTGGDSFYFPKNSNPDISKAQLELASMLLSKETQVKFNLAKGSLPVRGDVDLTAANACMKKGLEILATPENVLPGATQLLTPDTIGQLQDLSLQFFSSKMSVDDAIDKQAAIIKQAQ